MALDNHLDMSLPNSINDHVGQSRLNRGVEVNLWLFKDDDGVRRNVEAQYEYRKDLGHAEPDIGDEDLGRPSRLTDANLIEIASLCEGFNSKLLDESELLKPDRYILLEQEPLSALSS